MKMARPILIAGNWKMNEPEGALKSIGEIAIATRLHAKVEIVLFPPATLLARASLLTQATALRLGAQDCSTEASGSYTGELSASILKSGGQALYS
jgi:triosephosphate isomerase